jgi:6,7-dimethyl-8-ribityllumazine synthase
MLRANQTGKIRAGGGQFAIVASQYNPLYVDAMVRAARAELKRAGVRKVELFRVPGAFEIPVVAARLARDSSESGMESGVPRVSGIICLGVILRGETTHAEHIGKAVSYALMQIQLRYEVPVIHEVLLLENEAQARARCLDRKHNRGAEAAQTALAMAQVMRRIERG